MLCWYDMVIYSPEKLTCPLRFSMVGSDVFSYWNSPFFRGHVSFRERFSSVFSFLKLIWSSWPFLFIPPMSELPIGPMVSVWMPPPVSGTRYFADQTCENPLRLNSHCFPVVDDHQPKRRFFFNTYYQNSGNMTIPDISSWSTLAHI